MVDREALSGVIAIIKDVKGRLSQAEEMMTKMASGASNMYPSFSQQSEVQTVSDMGSTRRRLDFEPVNCCLSSDTANSSLSSSAPFQEKSKPQQAISKVSTPLSGSPKKSEQSVSEVTRKGEKGHLRSAKKTRLNEKYKRSSTVTWSPILTPPNQKKFRNPRLKHDNQRKALKCLKDKSQGSKSCYDCAEWFNAKERGGDKSCRHKYETTITPEKFWNISFTESESD